MNDEPCRAVEHQLQAYLDRALTPGEVTTIEEHLGRCDYCRDRYHFEAELRDTVKTVCCGDPVPADLVDRVRLAIRDQSA